MRTATYHPRTAACDNAQASHGISSRFCRKLHTAVTQLKEQMIARYEATGGSAGQIRAALTAAEAQAWETSFPHLVFPDLAEVHLGTVTDGDEALVSRRA
jgi:hypothetical protein